MSAGEIPSWLYQSSRGYVLSMLYSKGYNRTLDVNLPYLTILLFEEEK